MLMLCLVVVVVWVICLVDKYVHMHKNIRVFLCMQDVSAGFHACIAHLIAPAPSLRRAHNIIMLSAFACLACCMGQTYAEADDAKLMGALSRGGR